MFNLEYDIEEVKKTKGYEFLEEYFIGKYLDKDIKFSIRQNHKHNSNGTDIKIAYSSVTPNLKQVNISALELFSSDKTYEIFLDGSFSSSFSSSDNYFSKLFSFMDKNTGKNEIMKLKNKPSKILLKEILDDLSSEQGLKHPKEYHDKLNAILTQYTF